MGTKSIIAIVAAFSVCASACAAPTPQRNQEICAFLENAGMKSEAAVMKSVVAGQFDKDYVVQSSNYVLRQNSLAFSDAPRQYLMGSDVVEIESIYSYRDGVDVRITVLAFPRDSSRYFLIVERPQEKVKVVFYRDDSGAFVGLKDDLASTLNSYR